MINFNQLPEDARVWVYQCDMAFSEEQVKNIEQQLNDFSTQWLSHNKQLKASAEVRYNRFIILTVDEGYETPSGCSIDSSVALIKKIEAEMKVDMFNRMNFAWKNKEGKVLSAPRNEFSALYAKGEIGDDTIVFNNLVNTKTDLINKWEVALSTSWHARMV